MEQAIRGINGAAEGARGAITMLKMIKNLVQSDYTDEWADSELCLGHMVEGGLDAAINKLEGYCVHDLDVLAHNLEMEAGHNKN